MNFATLLGLMTALATSPQASPSASAVASPAAPIPSPSVSPAIAPSVTAVPASAAPAAAPISPTPAATTDPAAYKYRFVPRQPEHPAAGVPQIFAVYLNSDNLKSLGPIWIKVTTSPDVVKVISSNSGHVGIIPMIVPGDFEAFSKLPKVPFIASGMSVDLKFIATGPTGLKTTVTVPVKLQ